ncbi:hypothetical protein ACSBR1_012914 [Camellia fascicularis]
MKKSTKTNGVIRALHGTIEANSTLFHLRQLQRLNLALNDFKFSRISSEFGFLASCQLSGKFPENCFQLPNLRKLNVQDNLGVTDKLPNFNVTSSLQFLDLSLTSLFGQLPDSISNLKASNNPLGNISQLAFLTLFENQQTGPIPSYAVGISKLTYIGLQNNSLNGTIPSWLFAQPSLISIDLSNNMLQGPIPGSIYELQNLTYLRLSSNNFSGVIELDKFLKLKYMYYLDLSYNGLSLNINNSANSTLHYFETIGLASCNLSEFPNFLRVLHDLIALDLSNNKIHGEAPKWILDVGKNTLDVLDLSQNFLTSLECLPWKNLEHINLHSNLFRGPLPVPPITTIVFSISNNKLIGEIPTLICSLMSLEVLDLSNNSLSGVKFSKNIFHFPNLRELHVWGNLELTASLWNLTQITKLGFLSNSFSGQIPSSISNLAKINHLYHSQNNLNGQISDSLGNMSQLTSLSLSYNSLNGTIPSSLFALPSLVDIELSNNKLLGSIPGLVYELHNLTYLLLGVVELDKLLKLKNLIYLDLSYNGHIPTSLGNLTNLESLDLSSNELVGDIPPQLASLMFLEVLNLSDNQLVGQIPQGSQFNTFGNDSYNGNLALCGLPLSKKCEEQQLLPPPPTLQHDENSNWEGGFNWKVVLMGSGNVGVAATSAVVGQELWWLCWRGQIPLSISNLAKFTHLFLSNKNLNREIPDSIGNMCQLAFLDLSGNQLIGPIPLYAIGLSRFHGHIDAFKTKSKVPFTKLRIIDICYNEFSGPLPTNYIEKFEAMMNVMGYIPTSLGNLTNLESLDLSSNKLVGGDSLAIDKFDVS